MNFLKYKLNGIKKRARCIPYGLFYIRNSNFKISDKLIVNRKKVQLRFSNINPEEFVSICLDDVYKLSWLKKKIKNVSNIVDIGANQGMFLLAARQFFPVAGITCYEPNKHLQHNLSHNSLKLNAEVYYEAVTKTDCKVKLSLYESDLATITNVSENGDVPGTSLKKVIERCGGEVDIVKMDCEGAEWALLEDTDSFKKIRALSMEYHLWAKEGMNKQELEKLIARINFRIIRHTRLSAEQGVIVAINNFS